MTFKHSHLIALIALEDPRGPALNTHAHTIFCFRACRSQMATVMTH